MWCLQQDCTLAYAKLLTGGCAVAEAGREFCWGQRFGGDVMDAVVVFVCLEFVFLDVLGGVERGPGLAVGGDVLAGVLFALVRLSLRFIIELLI